MFGQKGFTPVQTVLIIDDSPTFRYLLRVYLSGLPIQIAEASDGEAGLAQVNAGEIALVIADLRMAGMDGFEFLRQLRSHSRRAKLPVILLTSETTPGLREEAQRLGASEFLTKPVVLARLRECVQRLLAAEPG